MASLNAEGVKWTSSPRLSQLNGKRWIVEGDYNVKEESFEVIQQIRSESETHTVTIVIERLRKPNVRTYKPNMEWKNTKEKKRFIISSPLFTTRITKGVECQIQPNN